MSNSIADLFIKEAIKTESCNFAEIAERLSQPRTIRLLHAGMGLSTEANEFLDALKKWVFYGKELDVVNLAEEIGDSDWYKAIACDELGKSFEEIQIAVIQKLRRRYANEFSPFDALNRDLFSERSELEKKIDLASGFKIGAKKLAETIKLEIPPVVHYLGDVETLAVLCKIKGEEDQFTLEENLVTCPRCLHILDVTGESNEPIKIIHHAIEEVNDIYSSVLTTCGLTVDSTKVTYKLALTTCKKCLMATKVNYDKQNS